MTNYIKSIAVVLVLFAVVMGGYFALGPGAWSEKRDSNIPIETTNWPQLIDPQFRGYFDDPKNWDYIDSLSDDALDALWLQSESALNATLEGKRVQIPGYMVSLDLRTDRQVEEFIFVPYQGACIHTPPPPPNQTILVKAPDGTKVWDNWEPVEVTGILSVDSVETDVASAGYTMTLEDIKPFEYQDETVGYGVSAGAHGG